MVVLSSKQNITRTPKTSNSVAFKTINANDYEDQKIQDNIQQLNLGLGSLIDSKSQQKMVVRVSKNYLYPTDPGVTSGYFLIFDEILTDPFNTFDSNLSAFRAPSNGLYNITMYGRFFRGGGATQATLVQCLNDKRPQTYALATGLATAMPLAASNLTICASTVVSNYDLLTPSASIYVNLKAGDTYRLMFQWSGGTVNMLHSQMAVTW